MAGYGKYGAYDPSWVKKVYGDLKNPLHLKDEDVANRLRERHRFNPTAQKAAVAFMEAAERNDPDYEEMRKGWAVLFDWHVEVLSCSTLADVDGDMIPVHTWDVKGLQMVLDLMDVEPRIMPEWWEHLDERSFLLVADYEDRRGIIDEIQSTPLLEGQSFASCHMTWKEFATASDFVQWVHDLTLGDPRLAPEMKTNRGR